MLVLTDDTSRLEIDLAAWDGDAYVTILVNSRGFTGRNDLHVGASDFRTFCSQLLSVQRTLKGEARLLGVNPEQLDIRIAPANSRGYFAVTGFTGYDVPVTEGERWHAVQFGFVIDPSQLDAAVHVPWVRKYAA